MPITRSTRPPPGPAPQPVRAGARWGGAPRAGGIGSKRGQGPQSNVLTLRLTSRPLRPGPRQRQRGQGQDRSTAAVAQRLASSTLDEASTSGREHSGEESGSESGSESDGASL